ncbi:reverse transcriptase domain-containing protein [Tanacetum coccineum]
MEAEKATDKEPKLENAWKLYTDGASTFDGSGAGLMLVSPKGKEYTYALRFEFETTNNEVEYEALILPSDPYRARKAMMRRCGIDIVGPLPMAPRGARFLVVAIDYFTKWVEAKPLVSTMGKHIEKFVWEHIVEVTNHDIVKGIEQRLGKTHQGWVDELPHVLWAHRTT